jgi:hypothetical protein
LWLLPVLLALNVHAALQFDVFPGYDGIVPQASWFPVVIEVNNDAPTFMGLVEITGGMGSSGQPVRLPVELPSGTLKRLVIPLFSSSYNFGGLVNLDVRLYDERGKLRAEQVGLRARRQTAMQVPVLGSLARSANGTPVIQPILSKDAELQPGSARFLPTIFPDNPLVLEGLQALYLNSAKAADLGVTQVEALLNWLHAGGHLIVGVEQISEISAAAWLNEMFPCNLKDVRPVQPHGELQDWVRSPAKAARAARFQLNRRVALSPGNPPRYDQGAESPETALQGNPFAELPIDSAFETNALQVAVGDLRDGKVLASADGTPLMVTANRGRGRLTVLLFSPEREPFRSWKNLPTFWARLLEVPALLYASADLSRPGGWSSDAVFGAMIDTRQVHKLPVEWLLVLLVIYLVVIGPLDQYWLKRIGKPMLTWITFPCYVVLFSLLIYFIGYKLRAGESEWNELNVVDILPRGDGAELRGRTYASVYSPVNQKYELQGRQQFSTLRGEFAANWNPGQANAERTTVWQSGDGFKAEIFVPVWTSQLFVNDWLQPADAPLALSVTAYAQGWQAKVENHTTNKLSNLHVVIGADIYELGEVGSKETRSFAVSKGKGTSLADFVEQYGSGFQQAIDQRRSTFGASGGGHLDDLPDCTTAVSFISQLSGRHHPQGYAQRYPQMDLSSSFVAPPGLDLTPIAEHGYAVLLAWAGDCGPGKSICQFTPRRLHRDTLWRLAVPLP